MANKDFCYCNGYRCALKEHCVRYRDVFIIKHHKEPSPFIVGKDFKR